MLNIHHEPNTNILMTTAVNKLSQDDYDRFIPLAESIIEEHGKLRWYFEMEDFDGWTLEALWSDAKFDFKHHDDFEKIAMVGRKDWMDWMTQLMKPFTSADIRFFELEAQAEARKWIKA
ncbi:MAG: STAS/SEC14 domain-containing protein [Lewinella sp.]|uniref:STAS/SEC14 domain-containing protein n=1 Tax=Lewinella sp. TaxID=2004506 RepID=UPI003D6B1032